MNYSVKILLLLVVTCLLRSMAAQPQVAGPALGQTESTNPATFVAAALAHIPSAELLRHYTATFDVLDLTYRPDGRPLNRYKSHDDPYKMESFMWVWPDPDRKAQLSQHNVTTFTHENGLSRIESETENGKRLPQAEVDKINAQNEAHHAAYLATNPLPQGKLLDVLTPEFSLQEMGRTALDGHDCVVFEASPRELLANPHRNQRYRLWIDPVGPYLLQYYEESLVDAHAEGGIPNITLKGTNRTVIYALHDGVPLIAQEVYTDLFDNEQRLQPMRSVNTWTYSNWHYFTAVVTIGPFNVVP